MRYPVGTVGSQKEIDDYWYVARGFGEFVDGSWYHEGVDLNLKTGADTDNGYPLYAIADGKIVYYHRYTHANSGYGKHLIYKIEGDWGVRWVHYAHCQDVDFLNSAVEVKEGQMIARIGKSGTILAHLHLAIYTKDPISNIDRWARTRTELYEWWENPMDFIKQWMNPPSNPVITDTTRIPQINNMEVREIRNLIDNQNSKLAQIKTIVS